MKYDRLLTRVWDKIEKKMIYMGGIVNNVANGNDDIKTRYRLMNCEGRFGHLVLCGITEVGTIRHKFIILCNSERFIQMRNAEFKDKNGKLIYNGDIVKDALGKNLVVRDLGITEGFIICNTENKDGIVNYRISDCLSLTTSKHVGTIYEELHLVKNPELLEEKANELR